MSDVRNGRPAPGMQPPGGTRAGAVVLAAGASSRMEAMGRGPKPLLTIGGQTFLERVARSAWAAGVERLVVVVGPPHGEHVRGRHPGLDFAWNPEPSRGMLGSVQAGLAALDGVDLALVWPVDLPLVRPETVAALLAATQHPVVATPQPLAASQQIVVPAHGGRGGHPLLLGAAFFAEAMALAPEAGLRTLLRARPEAVRRLPVDDPGTVEDIDTPADYARLVGGASLGE